MTLPKFSRLVALFSQPVDFRTASGMGFEGLVTV